MYYQTPFITTPTGAEGLGLDEEKFAVVEADQNMAEAIADLYVDVDRLDKISKECGPYINSHFTRKQALAVVREDIVI